MTLYVEKIGCGPDLVMLHGWGFNSEIWRTVAQDLSKNYCIHMVDLPGFGRSIDIEMSADIAGVVKQLMPYLPKTACYVGWSLGGLLAQGLALINPSRVQALFAIASTPCFLQKKHWRGVTTEFFQQFYDLVRDLPHKALKKFSLLCSPRQFSLQTFSFVSSANHISQLHGLRILAETDFRLELNRIQCPSYWYMGADDKLVPINQSLVDEVYSCSGHIPMLTAASETVHAIKRFFAHVC